LRISIIAIALEVVLILLIVGFSLGMLNDARNRQAGIARRQCRASAWIRETSLPPAVPYQDR
jgi:hypothetical protein